MDMKEKLIDLLREKGIDAEMGVTPVRFAYIMHLEKGDAARDFWFVESEGDIDAEITNFVKWNMTEYIFACVKNGDYENGRYMTGEIKELKDHGNPDGIHEKESFMTMSFAELVSALK